LKKKKKGFFSFVNIYVDLYFADFARVYFTIINVNVLTKEIKYMLILIFY